MITSRNPAPPPFATRSIKRSTCSASGPTPSSGDPSPQHVVAAPEPPSALDGRHVRGFLDHAQQTRIAPRVPADRARFLIGERAALAAGGHPRADRADRLSQARGGLRRLLQQVKRERSEERRVGKE